MFPPPVEKSTNLPSDDSLQSRGYHHGNLAEALLLATVEVIAESGLEKLSVREVAKRLGVSPGAPFRHYPSKTALLTAVAEQASQLLRQAVQVAMAKETSDDPIASLTAIGRGYLSWAMNNPTHFTVISSRQFIEFESSELLLRNNSELRALMLRLLADAQSKKILRADANPDHIILGARAIVYGLARMATDGHIEDWHPNEGIVSALDNAMMVYVSHLRAP
ncbi:TetR/AcrR family transcriptional regulator [Paracoccus sp. (in: a-proteobacteria)]|uniref:TetR/AcrR family transcriptional regulator n=1 Tax=Paracoccus sp. TaxID=267 RepID=UPI00289931B3|nr:TetR/AcrR family transcriptional regulator [Paracoccus sp. (in: a-proteobacteria)]